jgi:hypothetical protein
MTAEIINFPPRAPFAVYVKRIETCWVVLCRDHGWLHGDRAMQLQTPVPSRKASAPPWRCHHE